MPLAKDSPNRRANVILDKQALEDLRVCQVLLKEQGSYGSRWRREISASHAIRHGLRVLRRQLEDEAQVRT